MTTIDDARAWLADDPDARMCAELLASIAAAESGDAAAAAELDDAFAGTLQQLPASVGRQQCTRRGLVRWCHHDA